jgi:hypothetical protein
MVLSKRSHGSVGGIMLLEAIIAPVCAYTIRRSGKYWLGKPDCDMQRRSLGTFCTLSEIQERGPPVQFQEQVTEA